jgi:hypothetical protein
MRNTGDDLFPDGETEVGCHPGLLDKMDFVLAELKEIKEELGVIKSAQLSLNSNHDALCAAYKDHGLRLGQMAEQCERRHSPVPERISADSDRNFGDR